MEICEILQRQEREDPALPCKLLKFQQSKLFDISIYLRNFILCAKHFNRVLFSPFLSLTYSVNSHENETLHRYNTNKRGFGVENKREEIQSLHVISIKANEKLFTCLCCFVCFCSLFFFRPPISFPLFRDIIFPFSMFIL